MSDSPFGQPGSWRRQVEPAAGDDEPAEPVDPVKAPATALIWVACFGLFLNCACGIGGPMLRDRAPQMRPPGIDAEAWQAHQRGRDSVPFLEACFLGLAVLTVYPIMLIGAMQMMQHHNYWLSIVSALLALLPCSLVCIAGLPIGIWALIVLLNPRVKATFR